MEQPESMSCWSHLHIKFSLLHTVFISHVKETFGNSKIPPHLLRPMWVVPHSWSGHTFLALHCHMITLHTANTYLNRTSNSMTKAKYEVWYCIHMSGETRNACANRHLPSHFPKLSAQSGAVLWQNLTQNPKRTKPQRISSCDREMSTEYKERRHNYTSTKLIKSAYISHLWLNNTVRKKHTRKINFECLRHLCGQIN